MLGLIVFLCIICPWIIPCVFIIWILDKLCWKFIDWNVKWMSLPFKIRYWLSWGIVFIIFIPYCLILGGIEIALMFTIFFIVLFLIMSVIVSIILWLKKLFKGA